MRNRPRLAKMAQTPETGITPSKENMTEKFVSLNKVLAFVARTEARGVPRRVALTRAAIRFQVDREVLREAYREGPDGR